MSTANDDYLDASLRNQIGVRRYSAGLAKRVQRLLELADAELVDKLRTRLTRFEGRPLDFTGERWKTLVMDIRELRSATMQEYRDLTRPELNSLATQEAAREAVMLQSSIPVEISFATVAADQLRAIVSSRPFHGKLLGEWYKQLEQLDQQRLVQALQLGLSQGEPTDDIVRRVVGTRANKYADGILSITRRDATAIIRTAVNHVSNVARSYVWEANSDIITARIWHSTLDGRTSAVCRARDGLAVPVGGNPLPEGLQALKPPNATPPAHINCRSVMVAYIDGVGLIGNRPFVVDTRTPAKRETDFRAIARETGQDVKDVKQKWIAQNIGRVPSTTNYQEFLTRQSSEFQDDVLGKTKGKLFRTGKITVQEFVDRNGTELTLEQLTKTKPEVFKAAGLGG